MMPVGATNMGYVLVDKRLRTRHYNMPQGGGSYKTRAAAQAALTRAIMNSRVIPDQYEVMEIGEYHAQVPMREVVNLMTGKTVLERADIPYSCSVASEAYWSN